MLLIASFFSAVGFYLFYIKYQLQSFIPPSDSSWIFPLYRSLYFPEIEIPLYITGVIFTIFFSLLLYIFLRHLLKRFSAEIQVLSSRLFLKLMIVIDVLIYYLLIVCSIPLFDNLSLFYTLFFISNLVLIFVLFIMPQKFMNLFNHLDELLDWFFILGMVFLAGFLIYEIVFMREAINTRIISYFKKEEIFPFFAGFSLWQFLLVALTLGILSALWFRPSKEISRLANFSFIKYFADLMVFFAIIFFVSIVVVGDWSYPNYVIVPNYNSIVGPINDVLGGKTLLVNIPSQYGMLMIYTLAVLFKIIPLSYNNFFYLNFTVMVCGYYLLYLIMKRWLGWIALLGIFLIIGLHFFGPIVNILLYSQQTFLRWGWWVIFLAFILFSDKYHLSDGKKIMVELLIAGIAVFWAFDSGLYVLGGFIGFILIRALIHEDNLRKRFKKATIDLLSIIFILIVLGLGISIFTYQRAGSWPDWSRFNFMASQFTGGFGLLPMPVAGMYLVMLAVYFSMVLYILQAKKTQELLIISFITFYGMAQFIYYAGRSVESNLLMVITPFILVICYLLTKFKNYYQKHGLVFSQKRYLLAFWGMSLFLLVSFSLVATIVVANATMAHEKKERLIPLGFDDAALLPAHKQSIDFINYYLAGKKPGERRVAIISTWDGFFLVKTKSVNIIDSNHLDYFITIRQFEALGKQLVSANPDVIFTDHTNYYEMVPFIMYFVKDKYRLEKNVGYLDEWVRK